MSVARETMMARAVQQDAADANAALFRAQAVEAAAGTLGSALRVAPTSWTAITLFLLAGIAALAAFASTASLARKETAAGFLSPVGGVARVMPPRAGVLGRLAVADGDVVQAGQALFTVRSGAVLDDGVTTLDAALRAAIARQASSLAEEEAAEGRRAGAELARLRAQSRALDADIAAVTSQADLQDERVRVSEGRVRGAVELRVKGLISETELQARRDTWLGQRQALVALRQQLAALHSDLAQGADRRTQAEADGADRLARLHATLAELSQRGTETAARAAEVVTAPAAGRVSALQADAGQPVDPSRPVLTIVPEGATLRAELFVPSRAIGFVVPGQRVRLKYDAFPFERFGAYGGTVDTVSATVLRPDEARGPVRPAEPSYRVTARLDRTTVDALGAEVALQPEMGVRADILLEPRSLVAWAVEPLLASWRRTR